MREGLIEIDGTRGEGGGQLLRGALALAAATGRGFRITDIRRSRQRPGLMRQHLTAVHAAAAICDAHVEGAEVGATTLVFEPGSVRAGEHTFAIGTAGSCVLVLQAIVPALARLASASRITVTGGTHNPLAPTFEFLRDALAPQLAAIGWTVEYTLVRHGFYPAGGGELIATISPARATTRLVLVERGDRLAHASRAVVAHLTPKICERELDTLCTRLNWERGAVAVVEDSDSPGNFIEACERHGGCDIDRRTRSHRRARRELLRRCDASLSARDGTGRRISARSTARSTRANCGWRAPRDSLDASCRGAARAAAHVVRA
jgi:RNA 3'-terminal phosphate cyclase (ATP)